MDGKMRSSNSLEEFLWSYDFELYVDQRNCERMTFIDTYTFTINNYLHFKFAIYIANLLMICHVSFNVTTLLNEDCSKRVPHNAM